MSLLSVENLSIEYRTRRGVVRAVRNTSFELGAGKTLGVVGESGCGKSTLAMGVLGLLPPTAVVASGAVKFGNRDLVTLDSESLRALRWRKMAYVPQSAMNSLNPVARLRDQFAEIWRAHGGARDGMPDKAEALFVRVGLDPRRLQSYPHELSGGMRQRAIIAMALMFEPELLVADEPTTGLDVIVQRGVLNLLRRLQAEEKMSVIFVSHDIAVVAELCEHVAVMYAGEIVELGPARAIFGAPCHPYTMGLEQAFPDIRDPMRMLVSIAGTPPRLDRSLAGCPFTARCPFAVERCSVEKPAPRAIAPGHVVACHFAAEADSNRKRAREPLVWQRGETA
jgi:oligopeptide/dipeptide ABC transporter ATP-binding protein